MSDAAVRQSVTERLSRLQPDTNALWGRMTAPQMLCHLHDSFLVCLGEKPVSPATGLFQRTLMKWFALNVPLEWPKNLKTRPEVEQGAGGTSPTDFSRDRADLIMTIARCCRPDPAVGNHPHPFFGLMSSRNGCDGRICTRTITYANSVYKRGRLLPSDNVEDARRDPGAAAGARTDSS